MPASREGFSCVEVHAPAIITGMYTACSAAHRAIKKWIRNQKIRILWKILYRSTLGNLGAILIQCADVCSSHLHGLLKASFLGVIKPVVNCRLALSFVWGWRSFSASVSLWHPPAGPSRMSSTSRTRSAISHRLTIPDFCKFKIKVSCQ